MSIRTFGNRSPGYKGSSPSGNGIQNIAVNMGWTAVTASEAGDVAIIPISGLLISPLSQGVFFQGEVGAAVLFTLANDGLTTDPDPSVQTSVPWGNSLSLTAATIAKAPVLFTACKITFSAPGTVYIGAR